MRSTTALRAAAAVALLAGALTVTACGEKRDATAETGNATAEVTTTAPENVVSNTEINAAAVNAVTAADPNGAPYVKDGAGDTNAVAPATR